MRPTGDSSAAPISRWYPYRAARRIVLRPRCGVQSELPKGTRFVILKGGVRSFFGDYGMHPGRVPVIEQKKAQAQITGNAGVPGLPSTASTQEVAPVAELLSRQTTNSPLSPAPLRSNSQAKRLQRAQEDARRGRP